MAQSGFDQRFPAKRTQAAKALARNVRRLREARKWTQDELAGRLEIEQTAVSLIENSRANPTLRTLELIARTLKVSVMDLFDAGSAEEP